VISAEPEKADRIQKLAADSGVPVHVLGRVGGDALEIQIDGEARVSEGVSALEQIWREAIPALMRQ